MSVDKTQNDELNIHKSPKDLTSVTTKTTENLIYNHKLMKSFIMILDYPCH